MRLFNDSIFRRYKTPTPKSATPPSLPPAIPPPSEMTNATAKAGEAEGRRVRGRTGRRETQITTPGFMIPAYTTTPGLKTSLG